MIKDKQICDLLVVGASNGGMEAFIKILGGLNPDFQLPIVFVLHQQRSNKSILPNILSGHSNLIVKEPVDKEKITNCHVYVAPPDYHLLIESDKTLAYSFSEPLNYSRPSIDILFETAAESYTNRVAGLLLTGANNDGAVGLASISKIGGMTIVQDPTTARSREMPQAAIDLGCNENVLALDDIADFLNNIDSNNRSKPLDASE